MAQEGTLAKASERIHVVPSALTKSISDFEYQMKTQLFDRLPKGMKLTPQGERLFIFAKQFLSQAESFERVFHEKEDEIEGEIKIITTSYLGTEWLVPALNKFLKKHPKLNFKILLKNDDIHPAEGDIAIATLIPHQPHLIQHHLFTANIQLFASSTYLKEFGVPQTLADLNNHQLITYKGNHYSSYGSTNWILNAGNTVEMFSRKSYFEIDSLRGMLEAALQGYGIVEMPDYSRVLESGLKEVMPEFQGPKIDIYFIYPKSRNKSKKINLLLKYLSNEPK